MFEIGLAGTVERCFPFTVEYILTSTAALHFSVVGNRVNVFEAWAWGSTVFGVAGLVNSFEARKVVLWLLETCQQSHTGLVSCRFHSLEATRTSQATPGVSVAR